MQRFCDSRHADCLKIVFNRWVRSVFEECSCNDLRSINFYVIKVVFRNKIDGFVNWSLLSSLFIYFFIFFLCLTSHQPPRLVVMGSTVISTSDVLLVMSAVFISGIRTFRTSVSLWCQTEGQIPQTDFFSHALNIYEIPPLLDSLASQLLACVSLDYGEYGDVQLWREIIVHRFIVHKFTMHNLFVHMLIYKKFIA